MQRDEMKPVIEAVLFSMGEAVERKRLAQAFECSEEEIKSTVDELMTEYENRGIEIIEM
jgi:segregation and condensation protein B